ncbi:hypothetical protein AVEN_39050-1 [Araneus ventricosus]|uniref:Mos1 transposase HTH domain-containing protein n=1 Tax=Araneus ventricosus TaxID=182803 RepID=A0A4Y2VNN6_ARAVE|nr:hypothetical protein AVEN_39050-1 [Araneus ventricosus]
MMDSSRSAQRAVIQFLLAEGEHASQIYRRMKEVTESGVSHGAPYSGGVSVMRRRRVSIKELPRHGQASVVTNSATISAVGELIRQNRRITIREFAVELSISIGTLHHIIHQRLGYGKDCAQWVPKHLSENQKTERMGVCQDPSATQEFLH